MGETRRSSYENQNASSNDDKKRFEVALKDVLVDKAGLEENMGRLRS
jgi:hypothetical protein